MLILDALRSTVFGQCYLRFDSCWMVAHKGRKQAGFAAYFGLIRPQKNKSAGRMIVVYWLVGQVTHLPFLRSLPSPLPASIPDWVCLRCCRL